MAIGGILLTLALIFALGHDLEKQIPVIGAFSIAILRIMPAANRMITQFNILKYGGVAMEAIYDDLKGLPLDSDVPETQITEPLVLRDELKIENCILRSQEQCASLKSLIFYVKKI